MIIGKCKYNIFNVKKSHENVWPEVFASVPRVNDYVRGSGGLELKVLKVAHGTLVRNKKDCFGRRLKMETVPFITVYLGNII